MSVTDRSAIGVVCADRLYTLEALKICLGIRDGTLRAARRGGLQVYYKHGRGFVLGADWIAYVQGKDCHDRTPKGSGL